LTNLSVQLVYCSKHRMLLLQCTIGRIRQLTFSLKHHYVITLGRKLQSSNSSYGLNGVGLDERLTMLAAAAISQCSRYHSHETASSSHVQATNALLNADVEKPEGPRGPLWTADLLWWTGGPLELRPSASLAIVAITRPHQTRRTNCATLPSTISATCDVLAQQCCCCCWRFSCLLRSDVICSARLTLYLHLS